MTPRPGSSEGNGTHRDKQSSVQPMVKSAMRRETDGRALSAWLRRIKVIQEGSPERAPRPTEVFNTRVR